MDQLTGMSWDDVRVFLAVAREGAVRRAAALLGTSHSTVLRRIAALEESLAVLLFHRRREGYVMTSAGERVRDAALLLEDGMHDLRRQVHNSDARLSGHVRVALPDAFLPVLLRALPRFGTTYPGIALELVASTRYADLHRGEADVAVRIAEAPDDSLVGRRVATEIAGVYGSRVYARRVRKRALATLDWLGWERGATSAFANWIETHVQSSQVRLRLGGMPELEKAIDANLGVTLMPVTLGQAMPTWHCFHRLDEMQVAVWVLSHPDLKTTARVRVVRDFVADALTSTGAG
jgi:DNA-binding transcriptional LysR family regulator